jgi:hypothetical protein
MKKSGKSYLQHKIESYLDTETESESESDSDSEEEEEVAEIDDKESSEEWE